MQKERVKTRRSGSQRKPLHPLTFGNRKPDAPQPCAYRYHNVYAKISLVFHFSTLSKELQKQYRTSERKLQVKIDIMYRNRSRDADFLCFIYRYSGLLPYPTVLFCQFYFPIAYKRIPTFSKSFYGGIVVDGIHHRLFPYQRSQIVGKCSMPN